MMIREAIQKTQSASASPVKHSLKLDALKTLSQLNGKEQIRKYLTKFDTNSIAGHKKNSSSQLRSQAQMRKMIRRKSLINYKQMKH